MNHCRLSSTSHGGRSCKRGQSLCQTAALCVVGEACCTTARAPHCHLKSRRGSPCRAMRHRCQRHSDSLVLWRVQWLWWPQLQLRLLPQSRCRRWLLPVSWCLQCSSTQSHCRLSGTMNARHSSGGLVMLCSPRCCHCVGSGVRWSWAWLPWQIVCLCNSVLTCVDSHLQ